MTRGNGIALLFLGMCRLLYLRFKEFARGGIIIHDHRKMNRDCCMSLQTECLGEFVGPV